MLNRPLRLSAVVERTLSWQESIALVQSIVAASTDGRADGPQPSGAIADDFVLNQDGTIAPSDGYRRDVSASELALFLGQLLPADGSSAERAPAGVKFTIARTLGLVEAPPIGTVAQFSAALRRFERQERQSVLAALYERSAKVVVTGDRRQRRPAADVFRRLLREADERAWDAARAADGTRIDDRLGATRVDVLRRFLREADERNYLLVATLAQRKVAPPRAGGIAARRRLQSGIAVVALLGAAAIAEQQRVMPTSPARSLRAVGPGAHAAAAASGSPSPMPVGPPGGNASSLSADAATGRLPAMPALPSEPSALAPATARSTGTSTPGYAALHATGDSRPENRATTAQDAAGASTEPTGTAGAFNTGELAAVDSSQSRGRMVETLDANRRPVFSPSFSADGSAVFLDSAAGGAATAVMRAQQDGPGDARLHVVRLADDGARNYHPRVSPDNQMLAFDSDRDGERAVYLADRDGRHVRRVSGSGYAAVPTWSPDSRQLAFVKAEPDRPDVWNLWVLDVGGGEPRRVTNYSFGQPWGASWFPDGRRICYAHEDKLVVRDLADGGSQAYESPKPGRLVRQPAVSPKGRFVVFQLYGDGAWLLDVSDGSMRQILNDPSAEEFVWTRDGRQVAYHSKRSGDWGVWFMAPEQ